MNKLNNILNKYFKDNGNFDVDDFIHAYGDPRQALVLFRIYHPNLIEINGNVVLEYYIDGENGPEKLITLLEKKRKIKKGYTLRLSMVRNTLSFCQQPIRRRG